MQVSLSYDQEFDALLDSLRKKYGEKLFEIDGIGHKQLDLNRNAKEFLKNTTTTADVSVDANANVDSRDVIGYQFELPKPLFRLNSMYLLWKQMKRDMEEQTYANEIIESQIVGDIYINDFSDFGRPYCFNYSCYDIVLEGLPMIKKIKSVAPKSLYSFKSQVEQFIIVAANSTLGATGLADIFICMSWYAKKLYETGMDGHIQIQDGDCFREQYIRETLVSLIYTLNQPMRGNQSPFTNVSIYDDYFLEELCPHYLFPDGSTADPFYVKKVQKLFLEAMNEELHRTPITFPVTTACFSVDDASRIKDANFRRLIANMNVKWGFINIYCGKTSTLSSCCRLRSEADTEYFNSFGAGSTKIGSLGVVTLNLPRLARNSPDPESFITKMFAYGSMACYINAAKREIIGKRVRSGNMPLYTCGHMDLSKQYSTIGITGLYEALEILGYDITTEEGAVLVKRILHALHRVCAVFQAEFKAPHNIEQVPAESSSIKLAEKDRLIFGDNPYPYYSNQFIPLTAKADLLERIRLQGLFDKDFSGGAICHLNIEEEITEPLRIEELIDHCAQSGVVYWAVNYNLQRCTNGHMGVGKRETCLKCGAEITENFTRVVGFLTNTANWHKVRRTEDYPKREFY